MKTVAVTGTTRGIGLSLKRKMIERFNVLDLNRPTFDLGIPSTINNIDLSTVDVLVLNAGLANKNLIPNNFRDQDIDYWRNIISTQVIGNFMLMQNYLKVRDNGVIVVLSSIVVEQSRFSGRAVYTAAKTALSTMIDELSHEIKRTKQNIRLIEIRPGLTRNPEETPADGEDRIPTTYDQVADAIMFAIDHPTMTKVTFNNL
jgi:NAD(P)-dependent dehydrogenase (short-subunit alcohol dehydrogenase family)